MCACVREYVSAFVRACVRACVRECVRVCFCVGVCECWRPPWLSRLADLVFDTFLARLPSMYQVVWSVHFC